jgi:hypothetical protein
MMSGLVSLPSAGRRGPQVVAPYITAWSAEQYPSVAVVERREGGIGYQHEALTDRDRNGVLWFRMSFQQGEGRPEFGKVHPLRQRRAMQRLLCQVCAGPADRTEDGVLWLLRDHQEDWPSWPNGMGVTEPPVCASCVRLSLQLCPALRKGATVVRAGSFVVAGVHGLLYRGGSKPTALDDVTVSFQNPAIRWVRAVSLVRELRDCVILR